MDIFSELKSIAEEITLTESHFKVGQKVKCKASGMTGEVIKVDPEEKGKYYTVKQDSGKVMKYAPDELTAVMSESVDIKENFMKKIKKAMTAGKAMVPLTNALGSANEGDLQLVKNFIEKAVKITATTSSKSENEIRKMYYNTIGDTTKNKAMGKVLKAMANSMNEELELFAEASQALINKMRELSGGRVPTGAAFRELKKRAQEELKKEKSQKKAEPKKEKEVSKTSKGKTYTGSADPSDKNIIMQLRKAQDVDGNMDIRISPERTTRLKKAQIDTLLKQHDALTKPRDKRMFIAKLTQALRKK